MGAWGSLVAAAATSVALLVPVAAPWAAQAGSPADVVAAGQLAWSTPALALGDPDTAGTVAISGKAQVGQQLTLAAQGWPEGAVLTQQWFANGVAVSGATGPTLVLAPQHLGAMVTVTVTATSEGDDGAGQGSTQVSITSAPVGPVAAAVFTATPTPTISGTRRVGSVLTAVPGTWSPAATLSYQWRVEGVAVSGATGRTFTPRAGDRTKRVSVTVTGRRAGFTTVSRTSALTGAIGYGLFTAAPTPTISGTRRVGSVLTAVLGTWSPAATLSYQWRVEGVAVSGATGRTFTPRAGDRTKRVSVTVVGRRAGFSTVSRTSALTGAIGYGVFSAPNPTISGIPQIGATLTVKPGTWKPSATLTYRWKLNGVSISGATGSTYKVPSTAYGKRISVTVTGRRTAYTAASRTSAATVPVTKPFTSTAAPKISGRLYRVGWVLKGSVGAWSPAAAYSWQWRREGAAIAGATGSSYRLAPADRGKRISVSVTGSRAGYTPTRRTSGFTGAILAAPYGFTDTGRPATPPVAEYAPVAITALTDAQWAKITSAGVWRPAGECPGARSSFRRVTVPYWGLDGKTHRGYVNVHADVAKSTAAAFEAMYAKGFRIHRVEGIEHFGGWEWLASLGNVTSSLNCRKPSEANSPNAYSPHAWGRAVDINPVQNPYINPRTGTWDPSSPAAATAAGAIRYGGSVWSIFRSQGWQWSGTDSWRDYMHFDTGYPSRFRTGLGLPMLDVMVDLGVGALQMAGESAVLEK